MDEATTHNFKQKKKDAATAKEQQPHSLQDIVSLCLVAKHPTYFNKDTFFKIRCSLNQTRPHQAHINKTQQQVNYKSNSFQTETEVDEYDLSLFHPQKQNKKKER